MRLLIYGMQSSGASTLALLLAQKPDSAAFVDIWSMYAAPSLPHAEGVDVVAKVIVTTTFPLALHQERFQPDHTVLFLRHPEANYRSLAVKSYRNHCGFIEEKFALLNRIFCQKAGYDSLLHYEDLIFDPQGTVGALGSRVWGWDPGFLKFWRTQKQIEAFNNTQFPEIPERLEYGVGNHHFGGLRPPMADLTDVGECSATVRAWCPDVVEHYESLRQRRGPEWRVRPEFAKAALREESSEGGSKPGATD